MDLEPGMQDDPQDSGPRWQSPAIHIIFFISGAASLICQVIWTKQLQHLLGSSTFAVSVTVASFFLGLSLGSFLGGRLADRLARPMRAYACLEFTLGFAALAITWVLADWMRWVDWLVPWLAPESPLARPLTVLLGFVALLPPTALMGATLPLLAKHLVRERTALARKIGVLYGINTLGAAFGCLLVGFLLIGWIGVWNSALAAAAAYVLVAALAWGVALTATPSTVIAEEEVQSAAAASAADEEAARARRLVLVFGLSGFVAVAYEVIWFRALVNTGAQEIYAFSGMLAIYLLGLVLGAFICARFLAPHKADLLVYFARLQLLIAIASLVTLALLGRSKGLLDVLVDLSNQLLPAAVHHALGSATAFLLLCGLVLLLPATLIGIGFPLASELTVQRLSMLGGRLGLLYSCNTLGGVLGSLAAGFLFLPLLGSQGSLTLLTLANVALFLYLVATQPRLRDRPGYREGLLVGAAALASLFILGPDFLQRELTRFTTRHEVLSFSETADATIVVLGYDSPEAGRHQQILINGRSYANSILPCRRYMGMLAHLPALLARDPEQALVICVGTGTTVGSMTTHDSMKAIHAVDLFRNVFEVAPFFVPNNHSFHENPKVKQIVADGRHFLLTCPDSYDVLTFEPPPPSSAGVVSLYTEEFYRLAKRRMRPGGVLAQWIPLAMPRPELSWVMLQALCAEFPHVSLWLPNSMEAIAIASQEPLRIDLAQLAARMNQPGVKADLHNLGVDTPEDILAMFVIGDGELRRFLDQVPTVTDDRPRLEYFNFFPPGRNTYDDIVRLRQPVDPYLTTPLAERGRLDAAIRATDAMWREHELVITGHAEQARDLVRETLLLAPNNAYLQHRLAFLDALLRARQEE